MKKYEVFAKEIIEKVGGSENIQNVTHCMTRLRFSLKNEKLLKEDEILKMPEVTTAQKAGGNYQVVIGTHVGDVCQEILEQLELKECKVNESPKNGLNRIIDIITKVITPVLGVLIASGLIQGFLALLMATHLIAPTDGAYIIFHAVGNALFTFFPVILGYTAAKAFKMDGYVGMIIGASLVFPNILPNLTSGELLYPLFSDTIFQIDVYKTFFGIPILFPEMGYQSTVIPIILAMYFASKLESKLKSWIPDIVGFTLVPFLTLLISVPVTILIVGPIANIASILITYGVMTLYSTSPILTTVVVGIIYQPLVILGLHWPLITIGINNFAATGSDYIIPMIYTASFAQTAVVCAVYLKTKSTKTKGICIPAIISGLFCIIEPAIYGITLPVKKRFAFSMLGGVAGAIIISIFSTKMYAISVGVLGIVAFINPEKNDLTGLIIAIIAVMVTMVISFMLTYITYQENEQEEKSKNSKEENLLLAPIKLISPMKGFIKPLSKIEDKAFSENIMGKGIAIIPTEGNIFSPCDGQITSLLPSGHAVEILGNHGEKILIHIGMDTVKLNGQYFYPQKQVGDKVKTGELLLNFDLEEIKKAGYNLESPIVVLNTDQYLDILCHDNGMTNENEVIITVIPARKLENN